MELQPSANVRTKRAPLSHGGGVLRRGAPIYVGTSFRRAIFPFATDAAKENSRARLWFVLMISAVLAGAAPAAAVRSLTKSTASAESLRGILSWKQQRPPTSLEALAGVRFGLLK